MSPRTVKRIGNRDPTEEHSVSESKSDNSVSTSMFMMITR